MMDLSLARQLLAALRPGTHLVLVGDADQLPAVGPGMVLRDIVASGLAPVTRLTHIFRQAQTSLIVTNAHRINHGLMPLTPQRDCDFYLFRHPERRRSRRLGGGHRLPPHPRAVWPRAWA